MAVVPSRRSFLLTVGAGAVGIAATSASASPRSAVAATGAIPGATPPAAGAGAVPGLLVHVRNAATGELGVLVGEREIVLRDPAAVAAILRAAGLS